MITVNINYLFFIHYRLIHIINYLCCLLTLDLHTFIMIYLVYFIKYLFPY